MRADRIFQGIASLGAIVAMCLAVAAPARAALVWGAPVFNGTESTTSLGLISTVELTGVGMDYFVVTLIHPTEVQVLSVDAGAALPPASFPISGWAVSDIIEDIVYVDRIAPLEEDSTGILPAGQLLIFTFAGLATPDVVASVMLFSLDGPVLPEPLIAPSPIPEPSSWMLMAAGLMGLGLIAARRRT